jgi:hypothetical protein
MERLYVKVSYNFVVAELVLSPYFFLAIPVGAWIGSEGSRRLRLPDFKTVGTRRR